MGVIVLLGRYTFSTADLKNGLVVLPDEPGAKSVQKKKLIIIVAAVVVVALLIVLYFATGVI